MIFHPFLLSAEAEGRKRIGNSIKNESSFTEGHFYQLLQTINMKTKYFALLIAAMGSSLSLGASISNLKSAYSKNSTVYDGTNGDTLDVSTPTTLNVNANGSWTMAFTVSNLTGGGRNTHPERRRLNNNGRHAAASPWKTQTYSGYSASTPLTLFYTFNRGPVSISAMLGDNTSTLTTLGDLSSGATFNSVTMTQINFSAKDTSGNTWSAPNGITGKYTLNNFDLYTAVLTEDQMREYALSAVPEPAAASLSLLGLGIFLMRRRRA